MVEYNILKEVSLKSLAYDAEMVSKTKAHYFTYC